MSNERMLAPPISTVGTMIRTMPATSLECGLMALLSYPSDTEYGATRRSPMHLIRTYSAKCQEVMFSEVRYPHLRYVQGQRAAMPARVVVLLRRREGQRALTPFEIRKRR